MIWTKESHPWVAECRRSVRFGVAMVGPAAEWTDLFEWVQEAETFGFDSWWKADHPTRSMECWTLLSAVAQRTHTIRVGSLVSCIYYRQPALLARIAADVDRLSDGRLTLGLGIGDDEVEFGKLGLRFPPVPEREARLVETIEAVTGLWTDSPFSYRSRNVLLDRATVAPPAQQPRVPLLIGGGGERLTFRTAARYADAVNFGAHPWTGSAITVADVQRKLQALQRHCADAGRPLESMLRTHIVLPLVLGSSLEAAASKAGDTTQGMFAGTPELLIAHYRELVDAGMQYFIACVREHDRETLRLLGEEVLPAFQGVRPPAFD